METDGEVTEDRTGDFSLRKPRTSQLSAYCFSSSSYRNAPGDWTLYAKKSSLNCRKDENCCEKNWELQRIGRVKYVNIQAWLRGFMVKFHGGVLFSLSHKSQGRVLNKTILEFNRKAS